MTQTRTCIIDIDTAGIPHDHGRFNVNGPSVLPAPEWMTDRPGRCLMYFAHHVGQSIRLAAADEPLRPVARGLAASPQNGLRDPCLLADAGRRWLFYAASGEHAMGVTEL